MSRVFHRVLTRELPRAVRAEGVWIEDADGRRYLDGAGGAIVVGLAHDRQCASRAQAVYTPCGSSSARMRRSSSSLGGGVSPRSSETRISQPVLSRT